VSPTCRRQSNTDQRTALGSTAPGQLSGAVDTDRLLTPQPARDDPGAVRCRRAGSAEAHYIHRCSIHAKDAHISPEITSNFNDVTYRRNNGVVSMRSWDLAGPGARAASRTTSCSFRCRESASVPQRAPLEQAQQFQPLLTSPSRPGTGASEALAAAPGIAVRSAGGDQRGEAAAERGGQLVPERRRGNGSRFAKISVVNAASGPYMAAWTTGWRSGSRAARRPRSRWRRAAGWVRGDDGGDAAGDHDRAPADAVGQRGVGGQGEDLHQGSGGEQPQHS
jgi:hypothetical protein